MVSKSEVEAFIVRSILLELDLGVFLCGNFTATLLLFFVLGKVVQDFGAVTRDSVGDFGEIARGSSNAPPLCGVVMGMRVCDGSLPHAHRVERNR